jgi:transcriptional regulator with XRE-family HTH domain
MTNPLGPDIRALRKARGLTLQELAARLDRSTGWLSQVERGQTVPAIPDLARIAEVFGVTISFFFRSAARRPEERGLIQRAADRVALGSTASGLTEELLSPSLGGAFEMIKSTFAPGAHGGPQTPQPPREDGGTVIAGQLTLTIDGLTTTLQPGDSFHFAARPYSWRNDGPTPCEVIWVIAPPVY